MKNTEYVYAIVIHPDRLRGGYEVTVPDLPGCVARARTIREAVHNGKAAICECVEALLAEGKTLPEVRYRVSDM